MPGHDRDRYIETKVSEFQNIFRPLQILSRHFTRRGVHIKRKNTKKAVHDTAGRPVVLVGETFFWENMLNSGPPGCLF